MKRLRKTMSFVLIIAMLTLSFPLMQVTSLVVASGFTLDVNVKNEGIDISQELYGLFLEDINSAADGGLNPQMVKNYSFENWYFTSNSGTMTKTQASFKNQWTSSVPANFEVALTGGINANNTNFAALTGDQVLTNNGFTPNASSAQNTPSMPLELGVPIDVSIWTKAEPGYTGVIKIKAVDASGVALSNEVTLTPVVTGQWAKVVPQTKLVPTVKQLGRLSLSVEGSNGGVLNLDMVSLSPTNTYGYGNKNYGHGAGLRADLVQRLADLKPSFMRFAGGCIIEGVNSWAEDRVNYYNWENTIGPPEERKAIPNLWGNGNTNYGYMQSYGLGYHELLQLCEDWGAQAYPILNAGVACQVNAGSLAAQHPKKFIDHITHLIDYCWGNPNSTRAEEALWAQKRVANGHAAPFDLNYVGIGNENWDNKYLDNFNYMKYFIDEYTQTNYNRKITIIAATGVTIDDTAWGTGWNNMTNMDRLTVKDVIERLDGAGSAPEGSENQYMTWDNIMIDEHYYVSRDFEQTVDYSIYNDDRYDSYVREYKGKTPIKTFVGETATHTTRGSTEINGKGANSMAAALADAAYWAGVERNSDVVPHIAYAPLFLKTSRSNWTPDLIYFDEYTSEGSSSYYMQKMFANNYGTKQIKAQLDNGTWSYTVNNGAPLIGTTGASGYITNVKITREDGKVLLQDNFSDNRNGWARYTTSAGSFDIADNRLTFTGITGNNVVWLPDKANDPEWYNYTIEYTAVKTAGGNGNSGGFVAGVGMDASGNNRYWYRTGATDISSIHASAKAGSIRMGNVVQKERRPLLKATNTLSNQVDYINTANNRIPGNFEAVPLNEEIAMHFAFGVGEKIEAGYSSASVTKYAREYTFNVHPYQSDIYYSVTKDDDYVYIKLINRESFAKPLTLNLSGGLFDENAVITTLKAAVDTQVNTVGGANNSVPVDATLSVTGNKIVMDVPAYSINVIKVPYKKMEEGILYHLPFDGSLANKAGTALPGASGTANYTEGISGQAVSDATISLPDDIFSGITDYTVSAWFKTPAAPDENNKLFCIGNDSVRYMFFRPSNTSAADGRPEFVLTSNGVGREQKLVGNMSLAANTWYHLLVTQRSTYSKMYINGVEVAQLNETITYPFEMGKTTGNVIMFNGLVDEFKIHNTYTDRDTAAEKAVMHLSDAEAVALIKGMLNIPGETKQKAGLYTIGGDVSVTWSSSNTSVIDENGWVVRPETATDVTLTATIKKGSATDTAVYTTIVPGAAASDSVLSVDFTQKGPEIMETLFGAFFEDINWGADGGLYPEKFTNRSFEYFGHIWNATHPVATSAHNRTYHNICQTHGWLGVNGATFEVTNSAPNMNANNQNYAKLTVPTANGGLLNYGYGNITGRPTQNNEVNYPGMNFKKGDDYTFSMYVRGAVNTVATVTLYGGGTTDIAGMFGPGTYEVGKSSLLIRTTGDGWNKVSVPISVFRDVADASGLRADGFADIRFADPGVYYLDFISLFPKETFNNRENGLRKDLVEILRDMKPAFLRFPGGCVSEGTGPDNMYNWKKGVGPIEERKIDFDMWCEQNYSGGNSNKYYYQSFGIGYYEYMQLCEDLGMKAMPVLNAGIACELRELSTYGTTIYRGGVTPNQVNMDGLQPYIDDAIDFIEFCNGDPATNQWAALRASMGHPEPFNLEIMALGNEQQNGPNGTNMASTSPPEYSWYSLYYHEFEKQIHAKYPQIKLISSSGRSTSGTAYMTAYNWMLKGTAYSPGPKDLNYAYAVDEHGYYNNETTMLADFNRYNPDGTGVPATTANYLRGNRPYAFFGEYSYRPSGQPNNAQTALAEAVLMAGFEKNADIVAMSCYAPLFAKEGFQQWSPDAIWNTEYTSYGSADYYNQKMFAANVGDYYIPNDLTYAAKSVGDAATRPYQSVMFDEEANEIIIRAINPLRSSWDMKFSLNGVDYVNPVGRVIELGAAVDANGNPVRNLSNNSAAQRRVYDREFTWDGFAKEFYYTLKPYSSSVFRISLSNDSKMVSYVPPVSMALEDAGTVPELPSSVEVIYADGSKGFENVTWENKPDCFYDLAGFYRIKGDVANTGYEAVILLTIASSAPEKIMLSPTSLALKPALVGYGAAVPGVFTITNPTYNFANVTISLSGDDFTLSDTSLVVPVATGDEYGSATFKVTPKPGLALGKHTGSVIVTEGDEVLTASFVFEVFKKAPECYVDTSFDLLQLAPSEISGTTSYITNGSADKTRKGYIVQALYKGDMLETYAQTPFAVAPGTTAVEKTALTLPSLLSGDYSLKCFIWDENYIPLVEPVAFGEVPIPVIPDPCVWYDFNQTGSTANGTVIPDMSGNSRDGRINFASVTGSNATWNGSSLTLVNPSGATTSSSTGYWVNAPKGMCDGMDTLTVSLYARQTQTNTASNLFTFAVQQDPASSASRYFFLNNVGRHKATISATGNAGESAGGLFDQSISNQNVWEHYVMVLTPTNLKLYVDGVLKSDRSSNVTISQLGTDLNVDLGRSCWNGDRKWSGSFDDFRIYNAALSSDQVKELSAQVRGSGTDPRLPKTLTDDWAALTLSHQSGATLTSSLGAPPSTGPNGSTITWGATNPLYLSADGVVRQPSAAEGNQYAVLVATLTAPTGETITKAFRYFVQAAN